MRVGAGPEVRIVIGPPARGVVGLRFSADGRHLLAWDPVSVFRHVVGSKTVERIFDSGFSAWPRFVHGADVAVTTGDVVIAASDGLHRVSVDGGADTNLLADLATSVAVLPGGDVLVGTRDDGALRRMGPRGGGTVAAISFPEDVPQCLAVSPDGRRIACGLARGGVATLDRDLRGLWATEPAHDPVAAVAFSPDGHRLAWAERGHIHVVALPSG